MQEAKPITNYSAKAEVEDSIEKIIEGLFKV